MSVSRPGHAPGLIVRWREEDRLALVTDLFYTIDMNGRRSDPHMPDDTYNVRERIESFAKL